MTIHLDVRSVPYQKLSALGKAGVLVNGNMGPSEVQTYCALEDAGKNLMRAAVRQMDLSAHAYHCVLKLSRTPRKAGAKRTSC